MKHLKYMKGLSIKYKLMYMEHLKTVTNEFLGITLNVYTHNGDLWFRAFEIATILKYNNRREVIKHNIPDDEKMIVKKNIVFSNGKTIETLVTMVNESGLYRLIFLSDYEHRKMFKKMVIQSCFTILQV